MINNVSIIKSSHLYSFVLQLITFPVSSNLSVFIIKFSNYQIITLVKHKLP